MNYRPSPIQGKAWRHCSFEQRFRASFIIDRATGCWNWVKGKGYGWITYERKWIPAHRAAWLHFKGPIPEGYYALHKCDNLRCVNYKKHLYIGTKRDNAKDRMQRHPKSLRLIRKFQIAGGKGTQKFWDAMTTMQRKQFSMWRRRKQHQKYAGIPGKGH